MCFGGGWGKVRCLTLQAGGGAAGFAAVVVRVWAQRVSVV
jgi:hypothetical protein